jgi:hypothetical protein
VLPPTSARRGGVYAGLLLIYLAAWAGSAYLPLPRTDLETFFWPAADMGAAGQPLMVYAPGGQALYPDANGPLSLLPLMVVEWVSRSMGWLADGHLHKAVTLAVFSLFVLLMAGEGVRAIERLRGARLSQNHRLLAFAALALAPPNWQSMAGFGHIEQPLEILLVLVAARYAGERRAVPAGLALGLAVLARSPAVLMGIPLLLALARGRAWSRPATLVAVAGATVALVMTPFLLADRADVLHSLVFYRGALGVGAGSIWSLARGTGVENLAQHLDVAFAALLAAVVGGWLASTPGGLRGPRLYAALATAAAAFALLGKAVWPYYFFEVYEFTAVWALGRRRRLRGGAAALGAVIAMGLLAEVGSTTGLPPPRVRLEGTVMFLLLGSFLLLLVIASRRQDPMPEAASA